LFSAAFLVPAAALATAGIFFIQAPGFTIREHSLSWPPLLFLALTVLFFLFLLGQRKGTILLSSRFFSADPSRIMKEDLLSCLPLVFLALFPLLLVHYLDRADLLARARILAGIVLLAVLILKARSLSRCCGGRLRIPRLAEALASLPPWKTRVVLFLAFLLLANAGSWLLLSSGQTFAGDEPHYLLITQSLLRDGDFDLANNYADRDYTRTMLARVKLRPHTAPGTGGRYSFHSPGTSLLLFPFYALGSLIGGKALVLLIRLGMSIFGALLGIQIYLFARREWENPSVALGVWSVYGFTVPVFFYSLHVYPEIIAGLFAFTAFRLLVHSTRLSRSILVVCGLLIPSIIWLHAVKYLFLIGPLFLFAAWTCLKKHRVGLDFFFFLVPFVFVAAVYMLFQHSLYGSFSLASVSWRGAMTPSESLAYIKDVLTGIPFRIRWETLAGYFLDQRDGLLLYAPVYVFALPGMVEMARKNSRRLLLLLFLAAPYVLSSAFLTQRTGYAPQARPLTAVSWALAIPLGAFLVSCAKKVFRLLFAVCTAASFAVVSLLLLNPPALYQLTTAGEMDRAGRLFLQLSNLHFHLPRYLPSFLKIDNRHWLPNAAWMAGLLAFLLLYLAAGKHDFRVPHAGLLALLSAGILVLFFWLAFYPRVVLLQPERVTFSSGEKLTFYSLGRVARMSEPGVFHLPRDGRSYTFYFTSWRPLRELRMEHGSGHGEFAAEVRFFDLELFKGRVSHDAATLRVTRPPAYRFKRTNLYRLSLFIKKKSGVIAEKKPYRLVLQPLM